MNPALPLDCFVPDSEARQWADGRTYVYGSFDLSGDLAYCSREYHVFSSADLVSWHDHGRSFATEDDRLDETWRDETLFAPDCIRYDHAYHLFFCTASNGEGVARSASPSGPFVEPRIVQGAHMDAIDPAAFVDDDGTPYLFWGQFRARGARLAPDLRSIVPETLNRSLIDEQTHGFHEGASVRKRNGLYYLVYADISRGRPTALGYATAESPLGPYTKRGIVIDNAGCDPQTWNNHGSIAEVNGSWYIFYHRASQGTRYNRRLCIEPVEFRDDGSIPEVVMTTGGVEGALDPSDFMDASRACLLRGNLYAIPVRSPHFVATGTHGPRDDYHEVLANISDADAACYRFFEFHEESRFECFASSGTYGGEIELRLDDVAGEVIGRCTVPPTGDWGRFTTAVCEVTPVTGRHELWLVFRTGGGRSPGRLLNLRGFTLLRPQATGTQRP